MLKINQKKGFTLIEVMIGITMISIIFLALTSLFFSSLRANQVNLNTVSAHALAQEGVELIRNARDSNWLQNFNWIGTLRFSDIPLDLTNLKEIGDKLYLIASFDADPTYAGFKIKILEGIEDDEDLKESKEIILCEVTDSLSEVGQYFVNNFVGAEICEDYIEESANSEFRRYIEVEALEKDAKGNITKISVKSVVLWGEPWTDSDSPHEVVISTELTNWKKTAI